MFLSPAAVLVLLRLDEIDWRRQILSIRGRKAGNNTTYPLSASVGDAIVAYRTYPHIDQRARGIRAALLAARAARGHVRPTQP